jgi:hypothetical protein
MRIGSRRASRTSLQRSLQLAGHAVCGERLRPPLRLLLASAVLTVYKLNPPGRACMDAALKMYPEVEARFAKWGVRGSDVPDAQDVSAH